MSQYIIPLFIVLYIAVTYLLYRLERQSRLNAELAKYALMSGAALEYLKDELDKLKGETPVNEKA